MLNSLSGDGTGSSGRSECNALRDLFARTTKAMSNPGSQHDRRLNHWEAGRHLPQQFAVFTTMTLRFRWCVMRQSCHVMVCC